MAYRLLRTDDAYWRESNQMRVLNTDLGKQLETECLGARFWLLRPGQASTKHRHAQQEELYVPIRGRGHIRVDDELLELRPLDALLVEPSSVRQVFNDTDDEALWLVVGAPPEAANTLEMSEAQLRQLYPEGPRALPPELGGGTFGSRPAPGPG